MMIGGVDELGLIKDDFPSASERIRPVFQEEALQI